MPAEHMPADPKHPTPALTTSELSRYRRELENALAGKTLDERAPVRALLKTKLEEVIAEQDERAKIAADA